VLEVAREYRRRELPIDLIVVDFFHWRNQGDWSFDPEFFPDPGTFDWEQTQTLK
jgi:alpha-D-xyloside xylohydrolase